MSDDYYIDYSEMLLGFAEHVEKLLEGYRAHKNSGWEHVGHDDGYRELLTLKRCFEIMADEPDTERARFHERFPTKIEYKDVILPDGSKGLQGIFHDLHNAPPEKVSYAMRRAIDKDMQYYKSVSSLAGKLLDRYRKWWL